MILSFMILSAQPGQNPDRIMKGQNHEDRMLRAPGISSQLANNFDCCSAQKRTISSLRPSRLCGETLGSKSGRK
jgi:hypothetical protein